MCVLVDARLPQTLLRYGQNDPIIINIEVQVNKKIEFFLWASSSEMPDRRHQCGCVGGHKQISKCVRMH